MIQKDTEREVKEAIEAPSKPGSSGGRFKIDIAWSMMRIRQNKSPGKVPKFIFPTRSNQLYFCFSRHPHSACYPLDPQTGGLLVIIVFIPPLLYAVQPQSNLMFLVCDFLQLLVHVDDHLINFLPFSCIIHDGVLLEGYLKLGNDFVQVPLPSGQIFQAGFKGSHLVRGLHFHRCRREGFCDRHGRHQAHRARFLVAANRLAENIRAGFPGGDVRERRNGAVIVVALVDVAVVRSQTFAENYGHGYRVRWCGRGDRAACELCPRDSTWRCLSVLVDCARSISLPTRCCVSFALEWTLVGHVMERFFTGAPLWDSVGRC